ncbi:SUMF1/EgtB/PvdO family nonheme iron enzyme [Escherichia coli]|nr:SUMF1/EgtB/PvdO family nonheme iron enzyme [Escherichia coli]
MMLKLSVNGLEVSGKSITLPTEAQWEYELVAEASFSSLQIATTNVILTIQMTNLTSLMTWLQSSSYPPNPLGLYDMMGNGNEWVNDWYAEDYYKNSPEKIRKDQIKVTKK